VFGFVGYQFGFTGNKTEKKKVTVNRKGNQALIPYSFSEIS
jgi:hypothetical protein